jgi:aldose sugar dehydrogenase
MRPGCNFYRSLNAELRRIQVRELFAISALVGLALASLPANAQQPPPIGVPVAPLGAGPFIMDTAEQHKIRVTVVARGLEHPWSIVFLPDGSMLITERPGRLRVVRNGALVPTPVSGLPEVRTKGNGGLMDAALHPQFAENHLFYFTYTKPVEDGKGAPTLARGKLEDGVLKDVRDLLVTDSYEGTGGLSARIVFGRDGMLYMATGGNVGWVAQQPSSLRGKILRMRDDGSAPPDNPFIGRAGYRPEIYSLGHRNSLGLIVHPVTGALWNHENGPNGGDKIDIILPGRNYGWPVVSFGREYAGPRVSESPTKEGMEQPLVVWIPSIAVAGMAVYTGDRFPNWKNNVFVGSMRTGEIPGTGHLERIVFNESTEELRRESMLGELRQRIREVRQGPDGFLYLLTDEDDGALLRIEPAQ